MINGSIFGQQLISEVERDSIVAKIHRLNECKERLSLANEVILEGDKTIVAAKNVISSQDFMIVDLKAAVKLLKSNETDYKLYIKTDKKQQNKKKFTRFMQGVGIGIVGGLLIAN